jgi:hypothetical protein
LVLGRFRVALRSGESGMMSPVAKGTKLYCNFAAKVDHWLTSRLKKVSNTF